MTTPSRSVRPTTARPTGARPDHQKLAVSVVVPSRDRPDQLAACLDALAAQDDDQPFEVVVVDDRSIDSVAVAAVVARHPRARLVVGEGRGPAAARNLGAREAIAPLICFTDDDCRPGPGWVAAHRRRLEAGAAATAGPTRNALPHNPWATASQLVTNHLSAASRRGERLGFAPTSNVACRAELHRAVPFDESFPLAAGEDREWCTRLVERGDDLVHVTDAWVDHHQHLTLRSFWRQQLRYGRGAHRWHRARTRGERLQPARFYVDLLRQAWRSGPHVAALVVVAQAATAAGIAAEARARRHPA